MYLTYGFVIAFIQFGNCDWISEWLSPIQNQLSEISMQFQDVNKRIKNDNFAQINQYVENQDILKKSIANDEIYPVSNILPHLEEALAKANTLSENLSREIRIVSNRELLLKDAIVNGRSGISTLTVTMIGRTPRTYMIRDTYWTLCNGFIQYPVSRFAEFSSNPITIPRCIGEEIPSRRDPCVFNSIIKYETIPTTRHSVYVEDDYLCLKPNFNSTLEKYLSVPRNMVKNTCKNGIARSLSENTRECGSKIMAEYTYYPINPTAKLPLEYCTEQDGSCVLTIAWQISNETLENFEFLKNSNDFKKIFIKSQFDSEALI